MNNLKEILKNPRDKLFAVDLDGTLSKDTFWGKELSKINISEDFYKWSVEAIKYLNEEENVEQIKIQTSLKKKTLNQYRNV